MMPHSKWNKRIWVALLVIAAIVTGFARDALFVNINYRLQQLLQPEQANERYVPPEFLAQFTYAQLYAGKWLLTALFSAVFFGLTFFLLRLLFTNRKVLQILFYAYGLLIGAAAISFGFGWIAGHLQKGYEFARIFMHIAQSPVVLMVLVPAFMLASRQKKAA